MLEAAMYVALGFCTAGFIALAILPAFYRRAARLTEEALRAVNPSSYAEVRAAQDHERARHAVELRRVEKKLETQREKAANHQLDVSRLTTEIAALNKVRKIETIDFEAKLSALENDQKAADLLSDEIKDLKQKLADAEKALAESWSELEKEKAAAAKASEQIKEAEEWLPATGTMALANITGLEAEVATLKAKLANYEPSVASEYDTERTETAKNRLSELEAQLVDTESKYIAAQAEVTHLSLQLDATSNKDTDLHQKLTSQIEDLANENARHQAKLQSKERLVDRLNGQIEKLRRDLISVPALTNLRNDFQQLVSKFSIDEQPVTPASKSAPAAAVTQLQTITDVAAIDNSMKPKKSRRQTIDNKKNKTQSAPVAPPILPEPSKTADIASAAEALVSRIVASNRGRLDTGKPTEAKPDTKLAAEVGNKSSARKSKTAKQKNKDVA
ncbi:MAG: hypothetical protein ABJY83_22945 [Roseibium sp.]